MVDEALSLVLIDPTRLDGPTEQNTTLENYTPSATDLSSPPSLVYADPFLENIPEVSILDMSSNISDLNTFVGYTLPFKENRGKPPIRYSLDIEKRKSKYPIPNYVSTRRLSKHLKTFVHVLSSSQIPTGVQEALFNPKWTQAIKEEIEALLKNNTWTIVSLPEGKKAVGCK